MPRSRSRRPARTSGSADATRLALPKSREVIKAFLARFTDEHAEPVSRLVAEEKRVHSEDRRVQVYRLVSTAGFESVDHQIGGASKQRDSVTSRRRATFTDHRHVIAEEVLVELPERTALADQFIGEAALFEREQR